MDKRAALKAAAAMVAFLIIFYLFYLACYGRIWADVALAVIGFGLAGYGFYDLFKD